MATTDAAVLYNREMSSRTYEAKVSELLATRLTAGWSACLDPQCGLPIDPASASNPSGRKFLVHPGCAMPCGHNSNQEREAA